MSEDLCSHLTYVYSIDYIWDTYEFPVDSARNDRNVLRRCAAPRGTRGGDGRSVGLQTEWLTSCHWPLVRAADETSPTTSITNNNNNNDDVLFDWSHISGRKHRSFPRMRREGWGDSGWGMAGLRVTC